MSQPVEISVGDREFTDTPVAIWVPLPEGSYLQINVTGEGLIVDAYDATDELVGTEGRTFDDWFDALKDATP